MVEKPAERVSISLGRGGKGTQRKTRNREVLSLLLVKEHRKRKQHRRSRGRSPTFHQTRRYSSLNLSCWLLGTPVAVMKNAAFALAAISGNEQHLLDLSYDSPSSVMLFIQFCILWNKMHVCRHKAVLVQKLKNTFCCLTLFLLAGSKINTAGKHNPFSAFPYLHSPCYSAKEICVSDTSELPLRPPV